MGPKKCMIIAEAGVNHNGNVETALRLCDAAKKSGADVIKFQTWITEKIITPSVDQADYQSRNTGVKQSQFEMLKALELTFEEFRRIREYCEGIGIQFASTADEEESLDFLLEIGIPFIKIGSGDVGNLPFLRYVGGKTLPVILSTGMSSLADVDMAVSALKEAGTGDISLLHCTTNYPCPYNEVNLKAMRTLQEAFHLPVGYSDHTIGTEVSVSAVAMGACLIEKHFTLDRNMEGPDHKASTEPEEFADMVSQIRNVEAALGDGFKRVTASENEIRKVVTKRIVARTAITSGEAFSQKNVCVKRSRDGELASMWDRIIGRTSSRDYEPDQGIVI